MDEHPLKQRFVLDTSVFITEEIRREDEPIEPALLRLLDLVAAAKLQLGISCYMPPSIHRELTTMLEDRDVGPEVFSKLDTWVIKKNPDRFGVTIPAEIVYGFIDEMSDRVNRGLRVSEKAVREAQELERDADDGRGHMTDADKLISDLREKYRRTLRQGVLDSREDFDLLILARELDAGVVTEDQGIISWAEDFGLRYMRGRKFPRLLEEYLRMATDVGDAAGIGVPDSAVAGSTAGDATTADDSDATNAADAPGENATDGGASVDEPADGTDDAAGDPASDASADGSASDESEPGG